MSDHTIQHVSDTALWVAAYRALESERPDALFRDPLAARLVGERGRRIAERMKGGSVVQWAVVVRTCIIDRMITEAIAAGVDTVLNLGAGLDTRPYRMDLPPALRWVEVDYPHLQEFKTKGLGDAPAKCVLERISLDLAERPARQELFARVNASARRVLVLTEGVTPYLTNDAVAELADDLHAQDKFQHWVLDYNSSGSMRRMLGQRKLRDQLKNAPFQFRPPDWIQFFAEHRWEIKEARYYPEEAERLGRPFRLPWWFKFLIWITPKQKLLAMRQMSGYVMLQPVR